MKLKIAEDLAVPADVVTEKLAFLGRTGTGKTYAAMKLAELMLEAGAQVVALDAVGKWYGLRVDGTGPGFPIPVFGGLNGDFPLEATGGKLMADLITDRGISAVLDVSQFTHAEQVRFAFDFATQFFQRKKAAPSAVHLFLEECQEFVPQNAMPGEQAMLSAFERLWKLGRNFGIGGSLISQRPQEINKKALNQTGTLFVFGMTGPQERKAIEQWVSAQGINEDIAEILPTLQQGQPHVWSPTFLGTSMTVRIAEKRTADVSATPRFGARAKERPLTPIDAEQLRTEMAATIERAKADDPKALRQRIAQLERELKTKPAAAAPTTIERVEVSVIQPEHLRAIAEAVRAAKEEAAKLQAEIVRGFNQSIDRIIKYAAPALAALGRMQTATPPPHGTTHQRAELRREGQPVHVDRAASHREEAIGALGKGERKILSAIAQYPDGATREQLTVLTGYKRSTRDTYLQRLSSGGLIASTSGGDLVVTDEGIAALGDDFDPLPTGRKLRDYWLDRLTGGEQVLLAAIVGAYPRAIVREELSERTDYKRSSIDAYLQRLISRRLVTMEGRGAVRASDILFD